MYNQSLFNCTRGNLNCESSATPGTQHYYVNTNDTIFGSGVNNMTDINYFPPNFGFKSGQVLPNDLLFMKGSDGSAWALITETTPIVMNTLYPNFSPEQELTVTANASGPWASPISCTLKLLKFESNILLTCTTAAISAATSANFISFLTAPLNVAGFTPVNNNILYAIAGNNNSIDKILSLQIDTDGRIFVYNDGSTFTNAGTCGFYRFCVTYQAA